MARPLLCHILVKKAIKTLCRRQFPAPVILSQMKQQLLAALNYVKEHKQQFGTGVIAVIGIVTLVWLFIYNQPVVYAATNACDLFTPNKAMNVLGDKVIQTGNSRPITTGDIATSKCGYTDQNEDTSKKLITSMAVQSAVNDKGIAKNKDIFTAHKKALGTNVKTVDNLGDSAYFETSTGILNVLSGKNWIKLLYGVGEGPTSKPQSEVVSLARDILK